MHDLEEPASPPPPPALVRSTRSPELMGSWSLVLEALGIEGRVINDGPLLHLIVLPGDQARAEAALLAHDRERRAEAETRPPAIPDGGWSAAGVGFAIAIAAFHFVTGPRAGTDPGGWFARGSSIANLVMGGEPFRAVTALSLHSDWGHVAGNAVAALLFVSALGRWMGGGMALLCTMLAGTAGNLLVAWIYRHHHNSVGASTATFAALGILGGLQMVRWLRGGEGIGRRRAILQVIGACLGVFAMLGVGEKVDVLAHLAGLGLGLGLGVVVARTFKFPLSRNLDLLAGLAAGALLSGAWLLAFR
ncbi:MAG TPA: rhomboid family intramembrane serine protease [Polyangia bacterium]